MTKVLLVEDNDMNRDMLMRFLQMEGFSVITAKNGLEALEIAAIDRPQLILMDISLPIMDGWEATRRLKSAEQTRSIPVLALTAHAMQEARQRSLAVGCDDFESKPVSFPQLLAKINLLTQTPR
jgi:two-component system, cell cycle response regulator DivK